MLDLEPGVHLHEVDLAGVEVVDELHGAGPHVPHGVRQRRRVAQDGGLQFPRQHGRARLLDDLLLVSLDTAVPQAQNLRVALGVAQDLHLDMTQRGDVAFEIDVAVAERRAGLHRDAVEGLVEVVGGLHDLDALAAAAVYRLDEHRIADNRGDVGRPVAVGEDAVAAGHHRHAVLDGGGDGVGLVAHGLHAGDRGADEVDAVGTDEFRELGILGQEADSRVKRVHLLVFGDADHGTGVQIAFVGGVAADADHGVARAEHVHRHRFHVRVRLHQHDAHAVAVRHPDQLDGGAAPGVDQHVADGPVEFLLADAPPRRDGGLLLGEDSGHDPVDHVLDGLLGHRNVRIDGPQFIVETG